VDGVSFAIDKGKGLGLVGESGCSKSVASLSILRLVAPPGGWVVFRGDNLLAKDAEGMRRLRDDMNMWSDAFIERVFPIRERSQALTREVRF
jgi:ABC-type oligopeptide transport system ATPase subunit